MSLWEKNWYPPPTGAIRRWKGEHREVLKLQVEGREFFFRGLTTQEHRDLSASLMAEPRTPVTALTALTMACEVCVLWPEEFDFIGDCPASIIAVLAEHIFEYSDLTYKEPDLN